MSRIGFLFLIFGFVRSVPVSIQDSIVSTTSPYSVSTSPLPVSSKVVSYKNDQAANLESVFHPDCADPHNKGVACTAHKVECDLLTFNESLYKHNPSAPFDLRIEPLAKSSSRLQDQKKKHLLHVDISWQMPLNGNSSTLRSFKLEIQGPENERNCFTFNVSEVEVNDDSSSPRFHFTTDSLFDFQKTYLVKLSTYPHSSKVGSISKVLTMPIDPELELSDPENITQYCRTHAPTPEASKWTAGFRKIFLQAITKTIHIEFVGAPAHYCFEEYEVRLLDETGIELLHHTIVRAADMKKEWIDGKLVTFGEHNFTNLELETDYIPSVIPVEIAHGKCVCPTSQETGACSCIAADWKKVRLDRVEVSLVRSTTTKPTTIEQGQNDKLFTIVFVIFVLIGMGVIMICCIAASIAICRNYEERRKEQCVRFVPKSNGKIADTHAPLIHTCGSTSVLILYSHDSIHHEAAVLAFGELLKNLFGYDVHLDVWDSSDIEKNWSEYVNASIVRADKIIVVNSVGAYLRVRSRYNRGDGIEKVESGPYDRLFTQQIDLALQHARVISIRFAYTPPAATIYALTPLLQYTIPDNISLLVSSLSDCSIMNDGRLVSYSPEMLKLNAAVSRMSQFIENEPKWFQKTHQRVPSLLPLSLPTDSIDSGFDSSSHNTSRDEIQISITNALKDIAEPSSAVIIPASPMIDEDIPLLEVRQPEDESLSYVEEQLEEASTKLDEQSNDSAFFSGPLTEDFGEHIEVRDKPRLHDNDLIVKTNYISNANNDSGIVESTILDTI
ncbi:unnamed protein product [Auanema sp. JU1783]|nr:unnamed protein product [Auanema sp. JU1783]